VSVVIPTWNAGPRFAETLEAVGAQRDCGEVELWVLDSESRDGTEDLARRHGARTRRILRATFNHGVTRNLGAALSAAPHVAFLTQDAVPADEHWLAALVDAVETEDAAGAYSRVVPRPDCSPLVERSVRDDLVYSRVRQVKRASAEEIAAMTPFQRRIFFHFNNVSSLVRRRDFTRRPFPEIPFGEDLAWGASVLQGGGTLVFEPASVVVHSHESRLLEDARRHADDARLMRTLFGFRNREGLADCIPGWWREVRRDLVHLRDGGYGSLEVVRWMAYGALLRAFQIAGQWRGSYLPLGRGPWFAAGLPPVERRPDADPCGP
jgi:rhamnosyltransferase